MYVLVVYNSHAQLNTDSDSIKIKQLKKEAYKSLKADDTILFKKLNNQLFKFSIKLGDTSSLAEYYWNNAVFYKNNEVMDSAYFNYSRAQEYYEFVNDTSLSARMLNNMAFVRGRLRDYTGGEVLLFDAIEKFEYLNDFKALSGCYNRLGLFYTELKEDQKALNYFNKALEYLDLIDNKGVLEESTFNNIGLMYHKSGNYPKAIEFYEEILKRDSLEYTHAQLYARLIDNYAYSRFLSGDTTNTKQQFQKSLSIREGFNNKSGIVMCKIHLANYFAFSKDTISAISCLKDANKLAKTIKNSRDYLASLKLLAKLDTPNSTAYLTEVVAINDSLLTAERRVRNKFMRISYETDKYIEETERLSQQKIWILTVAIASVVMLSLLYFLVRQRSKNKDLIFETKQQAYNEEIYKLMFKQQANLEKGRLDERQRISEELHDGVLSKLFGTRMGIGFLNLKGDQNTLEKHKEFINELQQVEKEIRVISHELKNDILDSQIDFLGLVENLLEKQKSIGKFEYEITSNDNIKWDAIDQKIKIHLYRIIQEGLSNVSKYSKAKNVKINFTIKDNFFTLTLEDDGIGFNKQRHKKGIGLLNMYTRTHKLNGEFHVDSEPSCGTKLTVSIHI